MRTHPWEVDDALWAHVQPLIPPPLPSIRPGRSRVDDRRVFGAILYVLRTGCQWNALPKELCSSSTAHRRFQEWEAGGFFRALWAAGLAGYDELKGIEWEWQTVDGAMTKAPFGGAATGANPTDRGKKGTKRSLRTDGQGIPLAIVVAGANRHDKVLLEATLDAEIVPRPEPSEEARQHLAMDRLRHEPGGGGKSRLRGPHPAAPRPRTKPAVRRGQPAATLGGGGGAQLAEPVAAAAGALGEEVGELPRHAPPGLRSADLRQAGAAFGGQGGIAYLNRPATRGISP
jgi:transposase